MQSDIYYSIVIPHKNTPDLLWRCLDSIPRRDDLQIIVVDDNSDPSVVDFERFPGGGDSTVEIVLTKENRGGGYARNIGLTKVKGIRVLFADADDFYTDILNDILNDRKNDVSDIIYFNANSIDSDTYQVMDRSEPLNRYIDMFCKSHWHNIEKKAELLLRYRFSEPWAKIIKKSLIDEHHIQFDETPINNDCTFSYLAGFHAKTVAVDSRIGYCVTSRPESLSYAPRSIEKQLARIYVFAKCALFFKHHNIHFIIDNYLEDWFRLFFSDRPNYRRAKKILLDLGYTKIELIAGFIRGFWRTAILFILPNRVAKAVKRKLFYI
jgi:glycosyltransferase involved in cell wall biosynthesis